MTKDFAMAGLRLGYILGEATLIKTISKFQPTWSVNAIAQAAGIAAIASIPYYQETLVRLKALQQNFFTQLHNIGHPIIPSFTHFGIIHVHQPAYNVRQALLKEAIQVRDCTSFGLPEYIRVSTQKEEDNQELINKLQIILRKQH
jgi:histidinol-phosphate/aromatic aminotransferase/cobyric acid decarboxylase-like protein